MPLKKKKNNNTIHKATQKKTDSSLVSCFDRTPRAAELEAIEEIRRNLSASYAVMDDDPQAGSLDQLVLGDMMCPPKFGGVPPQKMGDRDRFLTERNDVGVVSW